MPRRTGTELRITAEEKGKIKRHDFHYSVSNVAGDDESKDAADSWEAPDDIRIIGIHSYSFLDLDNNIDSGDMHMAAVLSRQAAYGAAHYDSILAKIYNQMSARACVVGAGTTELVFGTPLKEETYFFPEGMGIDVDEGEILYMSINRANSMANNHSVGAGFSIYYVERG